MWHHPLYTPPIQNLTPHIPYWCTNQQWVINRFNGFTTELAECMMLMMEDTNPKQKVTSFYFTKLSHPTKTSNSVGYCCIVPNQMKYLFRRVVSNVLLAVEQLVHRGDYEGLAFACVPCKMIRCLAFDSFIFNCHGETCIFKKSLGKSSLSFYKFADVNVKYSTLRVLSKILYLFFYKCMFCIILG